MRATREGNGRSFKTLAARTLVAALFASGAVLAPGCGVFEKVTGNDDSTVILDIQGDKEKVAPGGTVRLTINASTDKGDAAGDGTKVSVSLAPALGVITPTSAATVGGKAVVTFTAGPQTGETLVQAKSGKSTAQYAITVAKNTTGGGGGGGGTSADAIDVSQINWLDTSPARFKVTASLSGIKISGLTISWNWSQHGWPVEYSNGVMGNMWVFAKIKGRWYGATWEWLRANTNRVTLEAKAGQPPFIQSKASPISDWYPQSGEEIGFMASTPCRSGIPAGSPRERSPIVKTRWP